VGLTDDQKAMLRLLAQREQGYGDIAALTGQSVDDVRGKVKQAVAALEGDSAPADDQKAILRLLAQREDGYGDIAALTGQSVDGVRGKVGAALAELGGGASGQPAPKSEPVSKKDQPSKSPKPTEPEPSAEEAPVAKAAPAPPKTQPAAPKPASKEPAPACRGARLKLPEDRGAVYGLGAGLAVVLILVILLATGALGGSGDDSGSSSGGEVESTVASGQEASTGSVKPTHAVLKAVDGSSAGGEALFGKSKKQVVLLVRAKGLEPAPRGKTYTLSLAKSPTERLPLVATQVNKKGEVVGSFPIADQVLGLLASGYDEMELSIVANGELASALKDAKQAKAPPNYTGTDILRGPVTGAIVEAGEQGKVNP
jgi:hypothetical protein